MSSFAFEARDGTGRPHSGVMEAADSSALARQLRSQGWLVLEVRALDEPIPPSGAAPRRARSGLLPATRFDVETALRQLALMIDSGLTLLDALRAVGEHARRRRMGQVLESVAARIEAGATLFEAVARHPRQFPPLVQELIHAGEMSGTLDVAFERAAAHLEARRGLRAAAAQALLYPSIVLALAVLVSGFMIVNVIPRLESFLAASNRSLPAITQALLDVSHWFDRHGLQLAVALPALAVLLIVLDRQPSTRMVLDRTSYAIPLLGRVRTLAGTALFARSLSVLIENGVPLVQALRTVERLLERPVLRGAIERARQRVVEGGSLASSLARATGIAPIVAKMISIGERSGMLGRVLEDAARFHEQELAAWIRRMSFVVEPVITIVIGSIVGFVYIAFFVAMFSLAGG